MLLLTLLQLLARVSSADSLVLTRTAEKETRCCMNLPCNETCLLSNPSVEVCTRGVGRNGTYIVEDHDLQTVPGCAPGIAFPPLYYDVSGDGVLIKGRSLCNSDLCNRCPPPFEVCRWRKSKAARDLKCGCTPVGMNLTNLAITLGPAVNFGSLCVNFECKMSDVMSAIRRLRLGEVTLRYYEQTGFACAYESKGKWLGRMRYGCDIFGANDQIGIARRMSRRMYIKSEHAFHVECADADHCNRMSDYSRQIGVADQKLFMACPFDTWRSHCGASTQRLCFSFWLALFLLLNLFPIL